MNKHISMDTTNLQSIEVGSGLVKNSKFIITKDKLNPNPAINLQIDDIKNNVPRTFPTSSPKPNQVSNVLLYGIPIVSLYIEGLERLCLAQISNTLLKQFSYNEIHNRRVALGITCVQCTPVQLEILRRAGAMPVSSRRCGMITRREAERLCKSFLGDNSPPRLPDDFAFQVHHECAWGCRGSFLPSRYNSSRAKCIKCFYCGLFFSPNKFIFHSHRIGPGDKYIQPDAANFNSWRRHMKISGTPNEDIIYAWEDVKAMFNGGTRKRIMEASSENIIDSKIEKFGSNKRVKDLVPAIPSQKSSSSANFKPVISPKENSKSVDGSPRTVIPIPSVPNFNVNSLSSNSTQSLPFSRNFVMDYMWNAHQTKQNLHVSTNYSSLPLFKSNRECDLSIYPSNLATVSSNLKVFYNNSAFKPVNVVHNANSNEPLKEDQKCENDSDDDVDIETTEDDAFLLRPKCTDHSCENFCNNCESRDPEKPLNVYNEDYESNASSTIEVENSPVWDKGQDDFDLTIKKEDKPINQKSSPVIMTSSIHNEYMAAKNIWNVARLSNEYNQKTIFYNRYNHMMFNSAKIVGNNYEQNTI